jgi:phenylalanyl-tRNA synthetase beta chain
VGWLGELHPELVRQLDLTYVPVLFELDFDAALQIENAPFDEVSRFPLVRRDLALVVDEQVTFAAIRERVTLSASKLLKSVRVFDVYRGTGVEIGRKSVAISLIFQDDSRTLTDEDSDQLVASVRADLSATLNAKLRE